MRGAPAVRSLLAVLSGCVVIGASTSGWAQQGPTVPAGPGAGQPAAGRPATEATARPAAAASANADPAEAPVADADDPMPPIKPNDATHRSGFQVGLSFGVGPGAANGYPADARKIGRAAHYTESGIGLGTYGAAWIGGALADGFAFGIGAGGGTIQSDGLTSGEWNILFHADVYPLFSLGGAYRDLGLALEAGTGFATTENDAGDVLIDGNGAAYVSPAIFWEGLSVWKLRSGPYVGAHYLFSETLRRPVLLVGFRGTLTTGP